MDFFERVFYTSFIHNIVVFVVVPVWEYFFINCLALFFWEEHLRKFTEFLCKYSYAISKYDIELAFIAYFEL